MNMKFGLPNVGKYIMKDGRLADDTSQKEQVLGVVFDETDENIRFLPLFDTDCRQSYSLKEILDIAEEYDRKHGSQYLKWAVPSLSDWNMIISRLGKTQIRADEQVGFNDRMDEWTEFDGSTAIENLKNLDVTPQLSYWSCSQGYDDEVYFLNLETGTIEACPVWDDGEEYDYALRLVGCFCKKEINRQKLCDSFKA